MTLTSRTSLVLGTVLAASVAVAGGHGSPEDIYKMRNDLMKGIAQNMGVLGNMAKGAADYDAAAATAAADKILELASVDAATLWVEGTDNTVVPKSRVKPEMLANLDDALAKHEAMKVAAAAMQSAAGEGLEALQGAMGPLGGTCGDCHKVYRAPKG